MEIIYRLRLLGTIQVEKNGVPIRNFESRKSLALLGYLIRQHQPVSRSHLAGLFWGDKEEARGRRNLSRELSQLTARLPDCFQADYYTVQFQPPLTYWVDTLAFAELVKNGLSGQVSKGKDKEMAAVSETSGAWFSQHLASNIQPDKLGEAVTLYQGDFMVGFYLDDCPEFETWLLREQEGWRQQVTEILDRLINHHALREQDALAQTYARRWLELEPWCERAHCYLMLLLARNGQRSAALAQYEICRRALDEELAVEPGQETVTLYERIRAGELSRGAEGQGSRGETPSISPAPVQSLPKGLSLRPSARQSPPFHPLKIPIPPTEFINREEERARIAEQLANPTCRLLTLVGPGGIGKTHLALQATLEASKRFNGEAKVAASEKIFSDGVYFIPLDPLSSAEFLVETVADALNFSFYSGTDPINQLLNYLREKRMLLALDNFEHLPEGIDFVADILRHAPQVKILAASRERLNLQEEWVLPVQGLKTPLPTREGQAEALEKYSAVQLFLQRARAVQPGFIPSEENKPYIIRICQLVEGIPLAIELAAAWVRLLSCREISEEIERNLDFLATPLRNVPERHRSLRAVFDHSWQLLSSEEQRVFRQLAVFRGGFQREAAEEVTGASLPMLLALVDKSLLRSPQAGRYLRHILLWQYAAEKLEEIPTEKGKTEERHCDYYANFLHQRTAQLKGGQQKETLAEIGLEIENVRPSWRWAIAHGKIEAIEQALDSLFHFYDMRSWFQEGAEAFGLAAASLGGGAGENRETPNLKSQIVWGKLLARQGWFTFQLGQHGPARALLERGLALLRSLPGEPEAREGIVFALNYLGAVNRHLGEYEAAKQYLLESLIICQKVGDQAGLSIALNILAQVAYFQGDYSQARRLGQESLQLKQEIGDHWGMAFSLNNMGQVASALADYGEAKYFFQESLTICQEIGDRRGIALCFNHLGDVAQTQTEYQEAKRLYQESLTIFREIGNQAGLILTQTKLGHVSHALREDPAAQRYFTEALKMAIAIQVVPAALDALIGLVPLLMAAEEVKQRQALEILAFILNHPAASQDHQDRAARLLAELEPHFSAEQIGAAQARGQAGTLEMIVKKIAGEKRD
jgi:predicted ATPase/DNA-binding SARP family transcriptional activator